MFKWRQFEAKIIVCAVRWYLRYSLSYREVQELLAERGINVDHSTIWRWVHATGYKLANDGQDTRAIQQYLGHRNIQHTTRYTDLAPNRFKNFWRD